MQDWWTAMSPAVWNNHWTTLSSQTFEPSKGLVLLETLGCGLYVSRFNIDVSLLSSCLNLNPLLRYDKV